MNDTQMLIGAAIAVGVLVALTGSFAYRHGKKQGRDLQRIEDIEEMWSNMPRRDSRGRFAAHK